MIGDQCDQFIWFKWIRKFALGLFVGSFNAIFKIWRPKSGSEMSRNVSIQKPEVPQFDTIKLIK